MDNLINTLLASTFPLFISTISPEKNFAYFTLSDYIRFGAFMMPPFQPNFVCFWSWQLFFNLNKGCFWNTNFIPSFLSLWVFVVVTSHMVRTVSYNKIFNSVIKLISINVVDYFTLFKRSSNVILHYKSLFKNRLSINKEFFISIWSNTSSSINTTFFHRH